MATRDLQSFKTSDTATMKVVFPDTDDTVVVRSKPKPGAGKSKAIISMYNGKEIPQDQALIILERQHAGRVNARDILGILLFFGFLAGATLVMLAIELSR